MTPIDSAPEEWDEESWKELFESVVNTTARPHENTKDIIAGGWLLGKRRAKLFNREFWPAEDVAHSLCIFCWWPFKPALLTDARRFIREIRWVLFQGVSTSTKAMHRLDAAVPDKLLFLDTQELFHRLREEPISNVIQLRIPAR